MNKIVIFFSHAGDNYVVGDNGANYITNIEVGNTKIVADYISEITGADQYEIVTHKYDGMAYMPLINLAQEEATKGFSIFGHEVRTGKAKVEKWLSSYK